MNDLILKYRFPLLLLIGSLLYIAFLGLRDVWYPDEPDIAEVARAMFRSGDWISPRRMGEIWVDYPPMIYWVGTISSHVFGGMSAFSLRLPNAIAALATVFIVAYAGRRWFGTDAGFWVGFSLLTFLLFVYEGNSYRPDVTFTLAIAAGTIAYADGADGNPRLWLRALGFAFLGVAMLAKGPLGLLLPGLVFTLWNAYRREWLRVIELAPLSLVAVAGYLPWFIANAGAMGWDNMLYEFYAQNLERFLTAEYRGHLQPWYYFLRNFWLDFAPWSWLFPVTLLWLFRSGRWQQSKTQLCVWWFVAFFVFLSFAETKRQLYMLPAFPAVALLLGPWLAAVGRGRADDSGVAPRGRPVRVYALILAVVFVLGGIGLIYLSTVLLDIAATKDLNDQEAQVVIGVRAPLAVMGIVMTLGAIGMGRAWRKRDARACLIGIGAAHVALYAVILGLVMPAFAPVKSYRPQSEWISDQIGAETHFGMVDPYGVGRRGGFAYYTGTMVDLLDGAAEVERFFAAHPNSIVLIRDSSTRGIFAGDEEAWRGRILREIRAGSNLYIAVRGPQG